MTLHDPAFGHRPFEPDPIPRRPIGRPRKRRAPKRDPEGANVAADPRTPHTYVESKWRAEGRHGASVAWVTAAPFTGRDWTKTATAEIIEGLSWGWGYQRFDVVHLFNRRAPLSVRRGSERAYLKKLDPESLVGDQANDWNRRVLTRAELIFAAWGPTGGWEAERERALDFAVLFANLGVEGRVRCLGTDGFDPVAAPRFGNEPVIRPWTGVQ